MPTQAKLTPEATIANSQAELVALEQSLLAAIEATQAAKAAQLEIIAEAQAKQASAALKASTQALLEAHQPTAQNPTIALIHQEALFMNAALNKYLESFNRIRELVTQLPASRKTRIPQRLDGGFSIASPNDEGLVIESLQSIATNRARLEGAKGGAIAKLPSNWQIII